MDVRSFRRFALAVVVAGLVLFGGTHRAMLPLAHAGPTSHTVALLDGGGPTWPPPP